MFERFRLGLGTETQSEGTSLGLAEKIFNISELSLYGKHSLPGLVNIEVV